MSSDTKYKYAIVRLPESNVVDFFSLIVSKGYSDVSFVASLGQCTMRDDPNHEDQPTTSSSVKETTSNDDDSTSENNKCSPTRRQSSASQSATTTTTTRPMSSAVNVKTEAFDSWTPTGAASSNTTPDLLSAAVPAELLTNLFAKASGVDFDLSSNEWHENLKLSNGQGAAEKFHPYAPNSKNDSPLQTRMKGWQREYIKEVIKDSHYPTEEELRDIELKCDLSRKQILRFIAKRLTNPNRKPRVNHLDEKRREQEERDGFVVKDEDDESLHDVNGLHHILSSLQETATA
uniref:Uncharacterized protein n=1 Tax=Caenorhabditis japonica TaxID=281687 RepID=A0A8R1DHC9_CAEJA